MAFISNINQMPKMPGAYKLCRNNQVLYVGSTNNLQRRLQEHREGSHNPDINVTGFEHVYYECTKTVEQAEFLECKWYGHHKPPMNRIAPPNYEEWRLYYEKEYAFDLY